MALMQEKDRKAVREAFAGLNRPVEIVLFTSAESGEYSEVTHELLQEVVALNPLLSLRVFDLEQIKHMLPNWVSIKRPESSFSSVKNERITGCALPGYLVAMNLLPLLRRFAWPVGLLNPISNRQRWPCSRQFRPPCTSRSSSLQPAPIVHEQ
jgi:hypothetical protein